MRTMKCGLKCGISWEHINGACSSTATPGSISQIYFGQQ